MKLFYLVRVFPQGDGRARETPPIVEYERDTSEDGYARDASGNRLPVLYTDGAAAAARTLEYAPPDWCSEEDKACRIRESGKVQVRVWPSTVDDWQGRERARFTDGTYAPLPSDWPAPDAAHGTEEHFAHVSTEEPGKVSYTPDATKGMSDRQVRVRPGRYLEQFYSDVLTKEQIRKLATVFAGSYDTHKLKFAVTADAIEHVYTNGPSSCMSHSARSYKGNQHPVRAYAGPDLQVAYLEDANGRITARAVVWPAEHIYTRIYGDEDRLSTRLEGENYASGDLTGARLTKLRYHNTYCVPYVDGESYGQVRGDYIVIGESDRSGNGIVNLESTSGIGGNVETCHHCGNEVDEDDVCNVDGYTYCDDCAGEHTTYCEDDGEYHAIENCTQLHDGTYVSRHADTVTCSQTDETFLAADYDSIVELNDGTIVSRVWFDANGFTDDDGEHWASEADAIAAKAVADANDKRARAAPVSPDQTELPLGGAPSGGSFMAGDLVRVVNNTGWANEAALEIGRRWTVAASDRYGMVKLVGDGGEPGQERYWSAFRFALVYRPVTPALAAEYLAQMERVA